MLIYYGTIDEYLTGEHDKMVKTVWRFPSADELVMEVHDLAIGATGTQVRALRPQRTTLEDVFVSALADGAEQSA